MLRWLTSPLAGTAGVLAGLCLIAIPLRDLTSVPPVRAAMPAGPVVSAAAIPAVLRVKLLAPAKRLRLETVGGDVLLDMKQADAGESEHDAALRFTEGGIDIILRADFGGLREETAVFITVMPDGYEEQTRYATGGGVLEETLRYAWPHDH